MILRRRWEPLGAWTVGEAPEIYGYYELGDADGDFVDHGVSILCDELKEALAYDGAECVRWERAAPLDHVE